MIREQVLIFRVSEVSSKDQSLETQFQRLRREYDILGSVEDILDTWDPGNLIIRDDEITCPIAIKIGDGFIFGSESGKLHWARQLPELNELSSIDIHNPLLIVLMKLSLVVHRQTIWKSLEQAALTGYYHNDNLQPKEAST
ncbi:hypothetical protein N7507_002122 [Penicillium longicatenatum]|nr:hypothetical protein N7507_002122 [Penicillium longicatenatum]